MGSVEVGRQDGGGVVLGLVLGHERGEGVGPQQRRVAGEHHHGAVVVDVVVGEGGEADAHGVARAPLHALLDEVDVQVTEALLLHLLGHPLGAVADHDHGAVDGQVGEGVEHVEHHRPAAEQVEGLGPLRAHPRALAGGEDDGRDRTTAHGKVVPERAGSNRIMRTAHLPWPSSGGRNRTSVRRSKVCCPAVGRPPKAGIHGSGGGGRGRLACTVGPTASLPCLMGSLIKKRRKRMRKKKHKKMLKRTRFQRRNK